MIDYTNAFNFPVSPVIQILCALAAAALSYQDIHYSSLYRYVGFEEAHQLWKDSDGHFKYKANIIATAAIIAAFLIVGLTVYPPICFAGVVMGVPRFIYARTKLKKDIEFRTDKQLDFLDAVGKLVTPTDDDLALFFTSNYHGYTWGTDGDKIVKKGDHWVYELFPFVESVETDPALAHTELRRAIYDLSFKGLPY